MPAISDYLENALLDHLFRSQAYTMPTTIYVGLFTASPSDAGGGTEVSTSGTNYARIQVGPGLTSWLGTHGTTTGASSGTGGTISNALAIVFGVPGAVNWGTVTHFGIFDAVTSGNLLLWAGLTTPKTVSTGDAAPQFNIGGLTVSLD